MTPFEVRGGHKYYNCELGENMAIIKPIELPEEIRNEPFRRSEVLFFDAAKKLPDSCYVLYGVSWYIKIKNDTWSEGEADFVIISPETGIIIVEVKGGRIGRDDIGWYSIDRNEETHRIKDPVLQASNCKHKLLRYIRNNRYFTDRFLPAKHMVCFPNISIQDAPKIIEAPTEMQILSENLDDLYSCIMGFCKKNYDANAPRLTNNECLQIVNILKPSFDCPTRWSVQAARQNVIINSLTTEQNSIWDMIGENNRVSISGPAGSGKTILAIKCINECIKAGKRAAVLVPSNSLQEYYTASVNSKNLDTYCYHDDFQSFQASELIYDLVVIDEAQDLTENEWIDIYSFFDIEKSSQFVCVFDSNQMLSIGSSCPFERLTSLRLTKVIRNTKEIAEFSTKFYSGLSKPLIIGPDGEGIQYSAVKSIDEIYKQIIKTIRHYVFDEGFNYSDIVILFGDKGKSYFIKEMNSKPNALGVSFRSIKGVSKSYANKAEVILTDSVYRFRGLESKVVILTAIDDVIEKEQKSICYIGASRARNILHIIALEDTIAKINKEE